MVVEIEVHFFGNDGKCRDTRIGILRLVRVRVVANITGLITVSVLDYLHGILFGTYRHRIPEQTVEGLIACGPSGGGA